MGTAAERFDEAARARGWLQPEVESESDGEDYFSVEEDVVGEDRMQHAWSAGGASLQRVRGAADCPCRGLRRSRCLLAFGGTVLIELLLMRPRRDVWYGSGRLAPSEHAWSRP
jgi:hypothetical protein